ncbi:hypothetical protein SteCoe_23103 [Stentor coeruleus]|uniref:Rab-GAP TBC domain-containing protein n=1 Tax=Stentor coeruleus TaxID=5963 RepID=A0A1R2BKN3_9CILI|nr:hypothetical protein SteCoe_23103 [Stentor coeruleus]
MDQEKLLQLREAVMYSRNALYLRLAATSEKGLLSTEIRKSAWPIILAADNKPWEIQDYSNKDSELIERDIERSIFGTDVTDSYTEDQRQLKRKELSKIINTIVKKNPDLHYFQGFNQICTIFLVTAGINIAYHISEKSSLTLLKDTMRKGFEEGLIQQLKLIYDILEIADTSVATKLKTMYSYDGEIEIPAIAVPWVICWFSSTLNTWNDISRIFDFCIATHALAPIYLSAVVILWKKNELLACEEHYEVHQLFRDLDGIDVERLCCEAFSLMIKLKPSDLAMGHKEKFKIDSPVFMNDGLEEIFSRRMKERWLGKTIAGLVLVSAIVLGFKN